jgi:glycine/D-amino acid oxidase-like deaminating enzyme
VGVGLSVALHLAYHHVAVIDVARGDIVGGGLAAQTTGSVLVGAGVRATDTLDKAVLAVSGVGAASACQRVAKS